MYSITLEIPKTVQIVVECCKAEVQLSRSWNKNKPLCLEVLTVLSHNSIHHEVVNLCKSRLLMALRDSGRSSSVSPVAVILVAKQGTLAGILLYLAQCSHGVTTLEHETV